VNTTYDNTTSHPFVLADVISVRLHASQINNFLRQSHLCPRPGIFERPSTSSACASSINWPCCCTNESLSCCSSALASESLDWSPSSGSLLYLPLPPVFHLIALLASLHIHVLVPLRVDQAARGRLPIHPHGMLQRQVSFFYCSSSVCFVPTRRRSDDSSVRVRP